MRRAGRGLSAVILLVMGIGLIAIGAYLSFFQTKGFKSTTATIERIETIDKGYDSDNRRDIDHEVYVTYTVDGKTYTNMRLDTYASSYNPGKDVKIYYNPANPADIHGDVGIMGILMLIGGIILLPISFISFIRNFR